MTELNTIQISSLEKFRGQYEEVKRIKEIDVLRDEEFSYQIVCTAKSDIFFDRSSAQVKVESDIKGDIEVSLVKNVPVELPSFPDCFDDEYISREPGIYPDVLIPLSSNSFDIVTDVPYTIWINVKPCAENTAGKHKVKVTVKEATGQSSTEEITVNTAEAALAPQKLIFTQWIHYDCIANIHNAEVFSQKHWQLMERYIETAAKNGINMILTPLFTPPLDTERGGERRTVQLAEIYKDENNYHFGFDKLKRFTDMCIKHNIKYFEMPHLFTQWGAEAAPKIMAHTKNGYERIFGWDTASDSEEYKEFLKAFLLQLIEFYDGMGLKDKIFFHISDEPQRKDKESYSTAKSEVVPYIGGCKIIDALSDYEFYSEGIVEHPVAAIDFIHNFLDNGVKPWAYYCCAETKEVCNRFIAMPSRRNRVLGIILYKYDIEGFLHWGYNFYNSYLSKREIDPYSFTDADRNLPSGDAFSVYPYKDGAAESIRIKVFYDALQDMRALAALEDKIGRAEVIRLIDDTAGSPVTFTEYPHNDEYIFELRRKINEML